MAEQVEVVIKIPKYYLTHPQDYSCLAECVRRGTPLPKGHGRFGDIDWMLHKMDITDAQPITPNEHYAWDFCKEILNNIPTIIEADKEEL